MKKNHKDVQTKKIQIIRQLQAKKHKTSLNLDYVTRNQTSIILKYSSFSCNLKKKPPKNSTVNVPHLDTYNRTMEFFRQVVSKGQKEMFLDSLVFTNQTSTLQSL